MTRSPPPAPGPTAVVVSFATFDDPEALRHPPSVQLRLASSDPQDQASKTRAVAPFRSINSCAHIVILHGNENGKSVMTRPLSTSHRLQASAMTTVHGVTHVYGMNATGGSSTNNKTYHLHFVRLSDLQVMASRRRCCHADAPRCIFSLYGTLRMEYDVEPV